MKTELFDRYVREVGRRLPKRQRADVEAELHSLLMDALQDRVPEGEAEDVAGEEDQVAVLEEFGPPAEMAAQYTPPRRYVIGPRLYHIYWIVVAAVAGSLALAHVILLLMALWGQTGPSEALRTTGRMVGSYFNALLTALGSVTLTFLILERTLPDSALEDLDEEGKWDPRTLPPIEERGRFELGSVIAEIVLTVIALIVFNLFPHWIGLNFVGSIDGAPIVWHSMPMLSASFFALYLPLLNVLWIARIALNVVLLRMGQWRPSTRLADLILTVFGGYILYRMLFGSSLLTVEAVQPASLRETLGSIVLRLLPVALGIGLVATAVEAVQKLIRVFRTETTRVYGRPAGKAANR